MAKWVIRRAMDGKAVSSPMYCAESNPYLPDTGIFTIDECIASLVAPGEQVERAGYRRKILRGEKIVGFVELTESRPQA